MKGAILTILLVVASCDPTRTQPTNRGRLALGQPSAQAPALRSAVPTPASPPIEPSADPHAKALDASRTIPKVRHADSGGLAETVKLLPDRLRADAREPRRFRQSLLPRPLADARGFYVALLESTRQGAWRQQFKTHCADEYDGNVTTEGMSLVSDERNVIRMLVVIGGTGDHGHELRYMFDEHGRLRLLFLLYADVAGGTGEHLAFFHSDGSLAACDDLVGGSQGLARWSLCDDDNPLPVLDKDVAQILKDSARHTPRNRQREALQAVDPRAEFAKCNVTIVR
jgi:hypothetical protein